MTFSCLREMKVGEMIVILCDGSHMLCHNLGDEIINMSLFTHQRHSQISSQRYQLRSQGYLINLIEIDTKIIFEDSHRSSHINL